MHKPLLSLSCLLSLVLLACGCTVEPIAIHPDDPASSPRARQALGGIDSSLLSMVPAHVPIAIDLRESLGFADPDVVGVTVAPDTGQRYILDRYAGIFEIDLRGSATLLASLEDLPIPTPLPRSLWTDFVAMGERRFALTALGDGYLLDLDEDTMVEYFCYEPGWMPSEEVQLTQSVAFDPERAVLYAQPITFEENGLEDPDPFASSIGTYTLGGGQPSSWFGLADVDFLAGGAAVDRDGTLLLGRDDELYRFDPNEAGSFEMIDLLSEVTRIEGMAVDFERNQLLVVDGPSDRLVTVSLDL